MTNVRPKPATLLLQRMRAGDDAAAAELLPLVYDELHAMAHRQMQRQAAGHTLQTTALVNEAWIKLVDRKGADWESQTHFIRVAATAMRSILVDHARANRAQKRGGDLRKVALEEGVALTEESMDLMLSLNEALESLAEQDEELAAIAELRCFGGLTHEDIAKLNGVSTRTVERAWRTARAWLQRAVDAE